MTESINMKAVLPVIISILFFSAVDACVVPSKNYYITVPELVGSSTGIVFAKAVKGETKGSNNVYWLQPIKVLKGNNQERIVVSVSNALPGNTTPLGIHKKYSFWTHAVGGNHIDSDCILRPNFRIGHNYLIFLSDKPSLRSYEEILSNDDRWLTYVREFLDPEKEPRRVLSDSEFTSQFDSIHVYRCSSRIANERGRPRLVESIKGNPPKISPWPRLGDIGCGGTGQEFLYLSAGDDVQVLTVPVKDGIADVNSIAGGVELLGHNKLNILSIKGPAIKSTE